MRDDKNCNTDTSLEVQKNRILKLFSPEEIAFYSELLTRYDDSAPWNSLEIKITTEVDADGKQK